MNRQNLARSSTKHKSSAFSRLRQHATFRRFNEVGALHARYEQTIHSIDAAGNRNIGSTYSVYRCRHPPYRTDTADVVNDGAYGGGGVSSPLAGARPRIPCAPYDLEADERDASSVPLNPVVRSTERARILPSGEN